VKSELWHRLFGDSRERCPSLADYVRGRTVTYGIDRRGRGLMLTVLDYVAIERARVRR